MENNINNNVEEIARIKTLRSQSLDDMLDDVMGIAASAANAPDATPVAADAGPNGTVASDAPSI